jgi:peptidoglycan/LPS O-acetylase OafA/YrhL
MNKRIGVLDSFRAIAAMAVLFFHLTNRWFSYGHYGVQFFFIISGFVIFNTVDRIKSGKEFIFKRFFRLYPTYWVCVALTALTINIFQSASQEHISLLKFFANLTMIQELLGVENIDTSYWSLIPELFFYAMILGLYWIKQLRNIEYVGLIWLAVILLNAVFNIESHFPAIRLLNIRHGQLFLAGIMLYKMYKGIQTRLSVIIFFLCFATCVYVYPLFYPEIYSFTSNLLIMTFIFGSFLLFLKEKLNFIAIRPLQFIGLISYPLYLLHDKIGVILMKLSGLLFPDLPLLNLFIAIVIIFLLSYLVYQFIEKPVQLFSKYLLGKAEKKKAVL